MLKMMKRFLLIGTLALILLGAGVILAGEGDLPPQVIAVQPFPGEEMRD